MPRPQLTLHWPPKTLSVTAQKKDLLRASTGDDGFDKGASTGGRNILSMPWDKLRSRFVNNELHNNILLL
jgi:hypothetical protein